MVYSFYIEEKTLGSAIKTAIDGLLCDFNLGLEITKVEVT